MPSVPFPSDEDLLVAIQAGELAARDQLEPSFAGFLTKVARRRCSRLQLSDDHIEDIVQETYARVLDPKTKALDPGRRSARSYLAGLVFNAAKTWARSYRQRARTTETETPDGTVVVDPMEELIADRPERDFAEVITRDLFRAALRNESARTRRVVVAHYLADVELQTLAREEGISTFKVSRELRGFYKRAALPQRSFAA